MDLHTLESQRQQLLRQRQEAEQKEKKRLADLNENQATIERTDQQLRQVEAQQRKAQLEADIEQNQRYVADSLALFGQLGNEMQTMVEALEQLRVSQTAARLQQVFEQQQAHATRAAQDFAEAREPWPWAGRSDQSLSFEERKQMQAYGEAQRRAEYQTWSRFVPALFLRGAVAQWIADAPDDHQRRLRQVVGYVFTAEILNPSPGYSAQADAAERQRQNWRA